MAKTQQTPKVKNLTNETILIEWPDGSGIEIERERLAEIVAGDEVPGALLANLATSLALQGVDPRGNSLALKAALETTRVWK